MREIQLAALMSVVTCSVLLLITALELLQNELSLAVMVKNFRSRSGESKNE